MLEIKEQTKTYFSMNFSFCSLFLTCAFLTCLCAKHRKPDGDGSENDNSDGDCLGDFSDGVDGLEENLGSIESHFDLLFEEFSPLTRSQPRAFWNAHLAAISYSGIRDANQDLLCELKAFLKGVDNPVFTARVWQKAVQQDRFARRLLFEVKKGACDAVRNKIFMFLYTVHPIALLTRKEDFGDVDPADQCTVRVNDFKGKHLETLSRGIYADTTIHEILYEISGLDIQSTILSGDFLAIIEKTNELIRDPAFEMVGKHSKNGFLNIGYRPRFMFADGHAA